MDEGRVLNISSLAAEDVIPGSGHYSAAKAGVNMLTKTFAKGGPAHTSELHYAGAGSH